MRFYENRPANTDISLITVLPEQLQSPLLTAEWEHKLKMVEHGGLDADAFMAEISLMVNELVKTYSVIKGAEVLFPSDRDVVGKCPRCGGDVTESKKAFSARPMTAASVCGVITSSSPERKSRCQRRWQRLC